jgi:RimJ/RimL family protein N-acetyltransferase
MLVGEKVVLRSWLSSDLPDLQLMRNDLKLQQQLMTQPKGNSLDQVKDWLAVRTKAIDGVFFVVACKSSNQPAGYIQVSGLDLLQGMGRLGICIAPHAQGQGYGSEAMTLLESYLLNVFKCRKLVLEVLAENDTAIRLYARQSYRKVGCFHQHFYANDKYSDVVIMEKLICT